MKNIDEKEKKLSDTLQKLRELNIQDNKEIEEILSMRNQKNQFSLMKDAEQIYKDTAKSITKKNA